MKKRIFSFLLAILCILTMFSPTTTAEAATKSLSANTWQKITVTGNYYTVNAAGEGYITLYAKTGTGSGYIDVELLNSHKKDFGYHSMSAYSTTAEKIIVPVSKGTYYIHITDVYKTGYIKYTFTSITQPNNYCKKNAVKVTSNTKQDIYQTPDCSYNRYYKLTISTSRILKFYECNCDIDLYSSDGTSISLTETYIGDSNSTYNFYYRTPSLKSGTYYLVVKTYTSWDYSDYACWKWIY